MCGVPAENRFYQDSPMKCLHGNDQIVNTLGGRFYTSPKAYHINAFEGIFTDYFHLPHTEVCYNCMCGMTHFHNWGKHSCNNEFPYGDRQKVYLMWLLKVCSLQMNLQNVNKNVNFVNYCECKVFFPITLSIEYS